MIKYQGKWHTPVEFVRETAELGWPLAVAALEKSNTARREGRPAPGIDWCIRELVELTGAEMVVES